MVEDLHMRMTQKLCSGSDDEVKSCSKACEESYVRLKKLYDDQKDKLNDASVEIIAYTLALKKVEAQLLCHQQNQLAYEQKIRFIKIDLDDKTDVLAYHKTLLAEALKEKEDLKTKFENWKNSSRNLSKLLNTQMSVNDKFGLGYGDYRFCSILSYKNEVLQSVFMNKASDLEDTSVNDRFADVMHAVPPPMIGNYMPSGPDVEIDYSKFTYGTKQNSADESDSKPSEYASCESDSSVETSTSMPEPVENASKDDPYRALKDKGIVDSRYSRNMTGNKAHLADYQEFKGGSVTFGGSNGRITGKGKIKTGSADYKELASPKQTALGKDISNLLMVARFPKTTLPTSTMASAIICLATNQKFNFSRYILPSLVKNIEAAVPFFMFPRLLQLLIDYKLGDMSHHKDVYDNPSLTKKVFTNMKRVGTGFSELVTPLFDNMFVPAAKEVGLIQDDVQSISIPTKPSTSKPYKKHKTKKQQTQAPKVPSPEHSPEHMLPSPSNDLLPIGKYSMKLKELMDLCTHLSNKVLELESEVIDIKSTYKERNEKLEVRVDRLEEENRVLKKLHNVHSKVDTATPVVEKEKSFKHGRITADIDEDIKINLKEDQAKPYMIDLEHPKKVLSMQDVDDEEPAKVEEVLEVVTVAKLITEVVTTAEVTTTAEATKGMTYSKIRPLFEKHYNYNQAFLEEVNEEVTLLEKEVELKGHKREEATPLASKIPIVDYKIHLEINKTYFKITRADGNHMLFLSFSTLLKNFDREDPESLWKLVKERFKNTKPKNYTDDYLLKTLKTMFEQPDVEASV
nr:hypothetical protein [Tanacetum cinerariifolium]